MHQTSTHTHTGTEMMDEASKCEFDRIAKLLYAHMDSFTDDQKLQMYGLYKQAQFGDAQTVALTLSALAIAKWRAWDSRRGMSPESAARLYVSIGKAFEQNMSLAAQRQS